MRYIRKGKDIPHFLELSHQKPPATPKDAETRWRGFRKHKKKIAERLNTEQYGLCAYSEIRPDEEALGTHIEHVRPKGRYPSQTFDYYNLVLSALSDQDIRNRERGNVFGGHAKQSDFDEQRFVSCLESGCQEYFSYLSDGRVVPEDSLSPSQKENAQYTIDLLNLNCEYLKNKRKNWIDELDNAIEGCRGDDDLEALADLELGITNGKIRQFHSATLQRFDSLGHKIIKEQYPELL